MRLSLRRFAGTANGDAATLDGLDSTAFLLVDGSRAGATAGAQRFNNAITIYSPGANPTLLMVDETGPIRFSAEVYSDSAGDEPQFNFRHARGTLASSTNTQADDELGTIFFAGWGAGGFRTAATIRGYADGEFGTAGDTSDSPGRIEFLTVPDGSSAQTMRLVIRNTGLIGLTGITSPTAWLHLPASSTANAPLRLPAGTAPSAPNDGDIWKLSDAFVFYGEDATTNAVVNTLRLRRSSSGTPAAGFGAGFNVQLKSSTTAGQDAGRLIWEWDVATHASRASRGKLTAYYTSTEQEAIRWTADSGGVKLGFYGATSVAKQTVTGSRGGNAALASLLTALATLGVIVDSSS